MSAIPSSKVSGYGCSHRISSRWVGSGGWNGGIGSIGIRRALARTAFRQMFVAMRYSHERSDERPSNPASPRQAANKVSCSMSSASVSEPSRR